MLESKSTSFLLVGLMALALSGCGSASKDETPPHQFHKYQTVRLRADGRRAIILDLYDGPLYSVRYATNDGKYEWAKFHEGELESWPHEAESPLIINGPMGTGTKDKP